MGELRHEILLDIYGRFGHTDYSSRWDTPRYAVIREEFEGWVAQIFSVESAISVLKELSELPMFLAVFEFVLRLYPQYREKFLYWGKLWAQKKWGN